MSGNQNGEDLEEKEIARFIIWIVDLLPNLTKSGEPSFNYYDDNNNYNNLANLLGKITGI